MGVGAQAGVAREGYRYGAGSYLRLIDFISLNSRHESNKEEDTDMEGRVPGRVLHSHMSEPPEMRNVSAEKPHNTNS